MFEYLKNRMEESKDFWLYSIVVKIAKISLIKKIITAFIWIRRISNESDMDEKSTFRKKLNYTIFDRNEKIKKPDLRYLTYTLTSAKHFFYLFILNLFKDTTEQTVSHLLIYNSLNSWMRIFPFNTITLKN